MICKQCGREFHEERQRNKFCGRACHHVSMRKAADIVELEAMATRGERLKVMSIDLNLHRDRVTCLMKSRGLYLLWRQRRYLKAGSGSATTASAATARDLRSANTA